MITTAGFEDVLEIGRHNRRDVYSVWPQPVPALIPRHRRLGIRERVKADGSVEIALDEAEIAALIETLRGLEVESVAIALLHAYANPRHEQEIEARIAAALPHLTLCRSSRVSPEIREYERTSTTVLNALLQPIVTRYINRLEQRMREADFAPHLFLIQSNGGVCSPAVAAREPVRLLLSGPSGGAMAALGLSRLLHEPNLVAVDMGGTSYDVSVVRDDRLEIVTQSEIDRLPVRVPMIEIRTIGAGGGSIARVHAGRQVKVGPESAGARPGPVCYSRGGSEPTVTDANLALGRLDPAFFLGGKMPLDVAAAREAIRLRIAEPLEVEPDLAAAGILRLTNTSLAAAIRVSLFEKGLDPRDFTMLSFGGAGSVHACAVAEELGIRRIIFPVDASTLSARGILDANIEHAFARSRIMPFSPEAAGRIGESVAALQDEGARQLEADRVPAEHRRFAVTADLRYRGQAFELSIPWGDGGFDAIGLAAVAARFHAEHERRFSYCNPGDPVELVTLRLVATGFLPGLSTESASTETGTGSRIAERPVFVDGRWIDVPVHRREALEQMRALPGPAIIEEEYTTVFLAPRWSLRPVEAGHLVADFVGAALQESPA